MSEQSDRILAAVPPRICNRFRLVSLDIDRYTKQGPPFFSNMLRRTEAAGKHGQGDRTP